MKKEGEKAKYESPQTRLTHVNLENGFMSSGSIFEEEKGQDDGVSISGHEVGNTGDYTDLGWDGEGTQTNSAW